MKYIIHTPIGFIHSFSSSNQSVVFCAKKSDAKGFKSSAAAIKWAESHEDCGHGLGSFVVTF